MEQSYEQLKKLSEKNGEIEFEAQIPLPILDEMMRSEFLRAAENFEMQGFRKGKAPEHVVRQYVDEMHLLEDAANDALADAIRQIVGDEKLSIVGRPTVMVTKIALKNPVTFRVRYALYPSIALPDYKKIVASVLEKKTPIEITEKDIEEAVKRIHTMMNPGAPADTVPALTDDFVKQLGPFKTVEDFKTELKRQLTQEKEARAKELKREEMIKEIAAKTKFTVPPLLIEQELETFAADRDEELKRLGVSAEDYAKQIGKTLENLQADERNMIEEQIKTSFVVGKLREAESINPNEKDIQTSIAYLKMRYANEEESRLRRTAEAMIIQEKLFEALENIGIKDSDA